MKTTFNSVAEIYEELDATRARLGDTLARVGEREQLRGTTEGWCVAEIVEHIATVEHQMGRLMGMLLAQNAAGAGEPAAWPVSLDEMAERARGEKYKSPESIAPRGDVSLADSRARLQQSHDALLALRPRIESAGAATAHYPHPAFGPLDLYQWLAFHNLHVERHRRQIERIIGAEDE